MTEPKRWDASNCVRFCDRCDAEYGITAGADAGDDACAGCGNRHAPHIYPHPPADFDRLRDERDEMIRVSAANIATTQRNMDELRRVAGVLADAHRRIVRESRDDEQTPRAIARSALAVFDTLTEEKTDE